MRTAPCTSPSSIRGLPAPYNCNSMFGSETFACERAGSHIASWRFTHLRGEGCAFQSSRKNSGGFGGASEPVVDCETGLVLLCASALDAVMQSAARNTVVELRNINPPIR